jgi:hypothetical protein
MGDFHMNRTYNKGVRPKIAKKVSNFEDHAENFYSDKMFHFYNMVFRATYSTVKSHILRHALRPGCLNLRTVPQLIGSIFLLACHYTRKLFLGMPLKSNFRF